MKQAEFALLIETGAVGKVVIFRSVDAQCNYNGWTIFAYNYEGESLSRVSSDCVEVARERVQRIWASLDTAHSYIRALGWKKTIEIDSNAYAST